MESIFRMNVIGVTEGLNTYSYIFINGIQNTAEGLYTKPTIVTAWFDKPLKLKFNEKVEVRGETFAFKDKDKTYFKIHSITMPVTGDVVKVSHDFLHKK